MRLLPSRHSLPWWLLIISIAFNLGFGATYGVRTYGPVASRPSGGARLGGGVMSMIRLYEHLDLTPEQETAIERMNEGLLAEIDVLRGEVRATRLALAQRLSDATLDRGAVDQQLDTINATQRQAQQLVVDHLLKEKQLLRPDQLEAFDEVIRNRVCPGDGSGGGGRGGGRGMGDGRGAGRGDGSGRGRGGGRGEGRGG